MDTTRKKSIDLIKGIAMIMIILCHYNQLYNPGISFFDWLRMGCPIFFVASGYGITSLIEAKYQEIDTSKKSFYSSRFLSLAPAWYFAMVLFSILNRNTNLLSLIVNFLFLNGLSPSYNNTAIPGGWYIGATVLLYLITPYIYKTMRRSNNRKFVYAFTSCLSILLLGILFFLFNDVFNKNGFGYFFFLNHYPSYCLGILLYFNFKDRVLEQQRSLVYLLLGLAMFALSIYIYFNPFRLSIMIMSWIVGIGAYFVIYALLSYESRGCLRTNTLNKIIISFGKNSYCIYLFHTLSNMLLTLIFNMLSNYSIDTNGYLCFWIMIPFAIIMSYYIGVVASKIIYFIKTCINRNLSTK